jgi:hypothetical protein
VDQNHPARAGAAGKKTNVGHLYVVGAPRERRVRGDAFHCWVLLEVGRDRGMGNGRWGGKTPRPGHHHRSLASRRLSRTCNA